MQKLEVESKGATIALESDRDREWRLPSSCLLLPAAAKPLTNSVLRPTLGSLATNLQEQQS